ncbi:hypothetical protein HMPREF1544_12140 [Mucor circinelloides 1006PhL]|uniref:C2H2-type domain-containing protein n=1 Tax=Mucor circinelloides f. circinelloides (strain 1006PhL) TaxID=1220926 RepID=S2JF56_MUCC1|nr:hypothetical protein HMPREF1544_12140 [Mucor circinelloides 1006PhL]
MNSDTFNSRNLSWADHMDMDQPAIKVETDMSDGAFEFLVREHRECRFDSHNTAGTKREREQDDDDNAGLSDSMYFDYPEEGGYGDEAYVKGEPVQLNQPDVTVQKSPPSQGPKEAVKDTTNDENYCCGCNKIIPTSREFIQHIITKHSRVNIKHFHLKPDIDDPNNYCKACEKSYKTRAVYMTHLQKTHAFKISKSLKCVDQQQFISLTETEYYCCGCNQYMKDQISFEKHIEMNHQLSQIKHLHLRPDVNDLNFYCKACERKFYKRKRFACHLKAAHKILNTRPQRSILLQIPDISPTESEYYCSACNTLIEEYSTYLTHIKSQHSTSTIKHINVKPDFEDPHYYCKACEIKHDSKTKFEKHLRQVHHIESTKVTARIPDISMTETEYYCCACDTLVDDYTTYLAHIVSQHPTSRIKHIHIKPDITDINNYCKACERYYTSRKLYLLHLKNLHKILTNSTHNDANQSGNQDQFYCSGCDRYTKDQLGYQTHISFSHADTNIKHFNLKPDINDPSNYCKACEETFDDREAYRYHLKSTHSIKNAHLESESYQFTKSDHKEDRLQLANTPTPTTMERNLAPVQQVIGDNDKKRIDLNKIENYCHYCEKQYQDKEEFRVHLRELHSFITTRSRGTIFSTSLPKPEPAAPKKTMSFLPPLPKFKPFGKRKKRHPQGKRKLPDPNNANYKCDVCKSVFKYKSVFRQHCAGIHQMQLAPIRYKRNLKVIIRVPSKLKPKPLV